MIRLYLRHQRCGLSEWATRAPGFLPLIQFLLDNGANRSAICSYSTSYFGSAWGTALDLFAGYLVGKARAPGILVDEEIAKALIEKLAKDGDEPWRRFRVPQSSIRTTFHDILRPRLRSCSCSRNRLKVTNASYPDNETCQN